MLLAALGAPPPAAASDVEDAVRRLGSFDPDAFDAAFEELATRGPAVAEPLSRALRGHDRSSFAYSAGVALLESLPGRDGVHALAALEVRLTEEQTERCLDFIDTLWTATGGFHGNWTDDYLDCEYTFYGLLALGHLSLNG